MNIPFISIIVPVYNAELYLKDCINSILAQTYRNYELILVDDGSTDNSGKICDEYSCKNDFIHVFHKVNEGVTRARIFGVEKACGDYVFFVDADDYLDKNCVEILHNSNDGNVDIVVCSHYGVTNDGVWSRKLLSVGTFGKEGIDKILRNSLLFDTHTSTAGLPLYLWGKLLKKELVANNLDKGIGFWYGEDIISFISMVESADSMIVIDKPLYYYVYHDKQTISKPISQLWPAYVKVWETIEKMDKNLYFVDQLPNRIWSVYWGSIYLTYKSLDLIPFVRMMKKMRNEPIICEKIFNNCRLSFSPKLLYLFLKTRLYLFIYFSFLIRRGK